MGHIFYTIGHSNRCLEEFLELLQEHELEHVVDVRKLAGSKRYPHFNADALGQALADQDIGLSHSPGLTGRRKVSRDVAFEINAWWQNRSFHNYADHALSKEFHEALAGLIELGSEQSTVLMCAEAVWWRCHRRIIADYLIINDHRVQHIMGPGQVMPAELSDGAVTQDDGAIHYSANT